MPTDELPPDPIPLHRARRPAGGLPQGRPPLARNIIHAVLSDPELAREVGRAIYPRLSREREALQRERDDYAALLAHAQAEADAAAETATRASRAAAYLAAASGRLRAVQWSDRLGCLAAGILLGLLVAGVAGMR